MNIAACFKVLPEFSLLSETDWQACQGLNPDFGFVKQVFNTVEEGALELAVGLADQIRGQGTDIDLTALTVDGPGADLFLKQLLAAGYTHAVRIENGSGRDIRFHPTVVSRLITAYVKQDRHQDILIFGSQGAEGDNCQTGFLAAEHLGWPCIRNVTGLGYDGSSGLFRVESRAGATNITQQVRPPLVLVAGNIEAAPYLRVPTLKEKLQAAKKPVQVLPAADLGGKDLMGDEEERRLVRLYREQQKRKCAFISGPSSEETARRLYETCLKERLGR